MQSWEVFALMLALGGAGCDGCSGGPSFVNKVAPEDAAKGWAEKLKIPILGAACTAVDGDNDGYVSCVVSINRGDAVPIYQGLQCGELNSTKAGGCKPDSKNPKVDIVDWKTGPNCPACPPAPACPACPASPPCPSASASAATR